MVWGILKSVGSWVWSRGDRSAFLTGTPGELKDARRSNQSILKEINSEYSFEDLMLKLKLQYFGHLTQRTDSLEKSLTLGETEGGRKE